METLTLLLLFVFGTLANPAPTATTPTLFSFASSENQMLTLEFTQPKNQEFKTRYFEPPLLANSITQTPFGLRSYIVPEFLLQRDGQANGLMHEFHREPWSVGIISGLERGSLQPQGLSLGLALNDSLGLSTGWWFKDEEGKVQFGLQLRF